MPHIRSSSGDEQAPLKVKEVAAFLGVHVATVYREIDSGRLHALRVGNGRGTLRVPRPALAAYLDAAGTSGDEERPRATAA